MAMTPLHSAVAIGIVKLIPIPWISLPLALLSHILLDLYPEYYSSKPGPYTDFKKYDSKEITLGIVQLLLLIGISTFIIKSGSWIMFFAVFLANIFDLWDGIYKCLKKTHISFWFFHPNGIFPFKATTSWQFGKMMPIQNAVIDSIFVVLLLLL